MKTDGGGRGRDVILGPMSLGRASIFILVMGALVTRSAHADEAQARALVERWLAAQNEGDFAAYQQLYAAGFVGVRRSGTRVATLDRAGWLKERARMFKKRMTVEAADTRVETNERGFRVTLEQTWASESYRDVGTKLLELAPEDGELRIVREEMLASRPDPGLKGQGLLVWAAGSQAVAQEGLDGLVKVAVALGPTMVFADGFPRVLDRGNEPGVRAGEALVALGVCGAEEVGPMLELFGQLGTRVEVRPVVWPGAEGASCPTFVQARKGEGWGWPRAVASVTVAGHTLTVVALARPPEGPREHRFVAVLKKGRAVHQAMGDRGAGPAAELVGVAAAGAEIVVRERVIDPPCTPGDDGEHARVLRSIAYGVKNGAIDRRVREAEIVARGTCAELVPPPPPQL